MTVARVLLAAVLLMAVACSDGDQQTPEPPESASTSSDAAPGLRLTRPRAVHRATRLADGRVLFTGGCTEPGCGGFDAARTVDVYDPATQRMTVGPQMGSPRASGSATLLADGRVLLVGGYPGEGEPATATAEVFDPASDSFAPVGDLATARADHSATVLPDGRVLVAGGFGADGDAITSVEVFDPDVGEFTPAADLLQPRAAHAAALVDGRVLLVGGTARTDALAGTEWLDDERRSPGPTLVTPRVKHAVVSLEDGRALVVGGATTVEGRALLASTEIVDGSGVVAGPELSEGEYKLDGAVVRLADGRVVIAGGTRVNVFDPRTDEMSVLPAPVVPRRSFVSATPVGRRTVLVAGGYDDAIVPTDEARLVRVGG